jgi:AraC-like DNA-binding protein
MKRVIYQESMEGVSIERIIRDSEYSMDTKHWHTECEIQYIIEGSRIYFIGDRKIKLGKGSLIIVDADEIHQTTTGNEAYHERIMLLVEKEMFCDKYAAFGFGLADFFLKHRGKINIPAEKRKDAEKIFADIAEELHRKDEGFELSVQARMLELWLLVTRIKLHASSEDAAHDHGKSRLVAEVVNYIRVNYKQAMSLEGISEKFYVNKSYMSRIFKSTTGFTVNEYINIQRIRQAQLLIENPGLSISEVARMVGYENISYFIRVFKRYVESSPSQYRKKRIAYQQSIRQKSGK